MAGPGLEIESSDLELLPSEYQFLPSLELKKMATQDQSVGELRTAIAKVRMYLDEPAIRAKYTDDNILEMLSESYTLVIHDLFTAGQNVPTCRVDVAVTSGQPVYSLPPTIGEVMRIAKFNSSGLVEWELVPQSRLNPYGPGITFEGTTLFRLTPPFDGTITLEYIPSGEALLCVGRLAAASATTSSIVLASGGSTPMILGQVDRRDNAYLGSVLSLFAHEDGTSLPAGYVTYPVQRRIVSSYSVATRACGVQPDFAVDPSQASLNKDALSKYQIFELYPLEAPMVMQTVVYHAARSIANIEMKVARASMLTDLYVESKLTAGLRMANFQTRSGQRFEHDTPENRLFSRPLYDLEW